MATVILKSNAAVRDPTRTITLRRAYAAAMRRRFAALRKAVRSGVADGLLGFEGILDNGIIVSFLEWLRQQMDQIVLESDGAWMEPFLKEAFSRGIMRADTALRQAGFNLMPTESFGLFLFQDELDALILERVQELENIIEATLGQIQAQLTAAIPLGLSNAELQALVLDRVSKVGQTRGVTLAVTAVIGVLAEATLSRLARHGINQVSPQLEYTTALNPCVICKGLSERDNGFGPGIYTIGQARGLLPVHPRCRCGWLPVLVAVNLLRLRGRRLAYAA